MVHGLQNLTETEKDKLDQESLFGYDPVVEAYRLASSLSLLQRYYEQAQDELAYFDRVTQDILHAIELLDENGKVDLLEKMEELREVRRKRREIKDYIELAEPLHQVIRETPDLINRLKYAHSKADRIRKKHLSRTYTPREKSSMAEAFEEAAKKKYIHPN